MKKIELIRRLLNCPENLSQEISVRIVERDEHGVARSESFSQIDAIVDMNDDPCIVITKKNITEPRVI